MNECKSCEREARLINDKCIICSRLDSIDAILEKNVAALLNMMKALEAIQMFMKGR